MTVLLAVFLGFLAILGLAQLWEWLLLCWLRPKESILRYDVLVLKGPVDNMEQLLRYVRLSSERRELLIVDAGLDADSAALCRHLCAMEPELHFSGAEQAKMLIFPENKLER